MSLANILMCGAKLETYCKFYLFKEFQKNYKEKLRDIFVIAKATFRLFMILFQSNLQCEFVQKPIPQN